MILVTLFALSQLSAEPLVLENNHVRRILVEQDGRWRTTRIERASGDAALDCTGDEFGILLNTGRQLTIKDYTAAGPPREIRGTGQHAVAIDYVPAAELPAQAPRRITITYRIDDTPYLRKSITLEVACAAHVERLDVETLYLSAACSRGGFGEPLFINDQWFCGLEYPGGETHYDRGELRVSHFPAAKGTGSSCTVEGKTAVIGCGHPDDPLKLAFGDYMATFARPLPILLHYNSWYDFRTTELTIDNLLATFRAFSTAVLEPYDLTMDVFVPDDGWQDPESIWEPRVELYPDGFAPLRDQLWAAGTRLGLWLPFNGYNLDIKWGVKRGYQKSDRGRYYCLVEPKYNTALRAALKGLIEAGSIDYMKHDFNQLKCSAALHGHPTTERHGFEANLDAELDLLAYERELRPDIYQNVTSYVWHSPWWLAHCNTIWMAAGDFGYNTDWPQLSPREWAMSYRDAHFYDLYVERDVLVPLSAMMTHGIIHGRYQNLGGDDETIREWADYVVMYYGRGVQLIEWYITPDMMTRARWDILGQATRWALDNREVLREVERIGGDPRKGQPYGYVHWHGDRGILVLRNPAMTTQTLDVPFDKTVRFRGDVGRPFHGRIIYPYVERLPDLFTSGHDTQLAIPGATVLVVEVSPTPHPAPAAPPAPSRPRADTRITPDGLLVTIHPAAGPVDARRSVRCAATSSERIPPRIEITVDGTAGTPRYGRGAQWTFAALDLGAPDGTRPMSVTIAPTGDAAFSQSPIAIDAWLVSEMAAEPTASNGPRPLLDQDFVHRDAMPVAERLPLPGRNRQRGLSAKELAGITAAKLRIAVFDSNGEGGYANKPIVLNDHIIARAPANRGPLSAWDVQVIELPAEALAHIEQTNAVHIENGGGDYFKFGELSVAVRLGSGEWVESSRCQNVHSTHARWAHTEGTPFRGQTSETITLSFD